MIFIFGDSFADPCDSNYDYLWYKNLSSEKRINYGKSATGPIYTMGKVYDCIESKMINDGDKMVVMLSDPKREEHYDGMHGRMCLANYLYFLKTYSEKFKVRTIAFTCFAKMLDRKMVEGISSEYFRFVKDSLSWVSANEIGEEIPERDMRSNHFMKKNHLVLAGIIRNHFYDQKNDERWDMKTNTFYPSSEFIYDA